MALSLKNPENQAKVSSWLVIASLGMLVLAFVAAMAKGGFSWEDRQFVYAAASWRPPLVNGFAFLGLVLGGGAFWLAYSSAGERRNSRSGLSWTCFAISAFLIVMACIFIAAYRYMAFVVRPG